MTRSLMLGLFVAGAVAVPVTAGSAQAAPPVCVQYNDPIHMGSYPVCVLGKPSSNVAGPSVPTSVCEVTELVGYRWIKECEGVV